MTSSTGNAASRAVRAGGALGVFAGVVDKFPLGAVMRTEHLATHVMSIEEGPKGYQMFKDKEDGCVRAVFRPGA
jgi:threonine dehydrogenase-like Zn-dependent dehydrogenase